MKPSVFDGSWVADASQRESYLLALKEEQDRLMDLEPNVRNKGLVISEPDPLLFSAKLFAGLASDFPVWLRASSLSSADELEFAEIVDQYTARPSGIYVATGGTSGSLRFACHTWSSLQAAVSSLQGRVGDKPLRSWCCLPLRHVGGLMQVFRAVMSGGNVVFGQYRVHLVQVMRDKQASKPQASHRICPPHRLKTQPPRHLLKIPKHKQTTSRKTTYRFD